MQKSRPIISERIYAKGLKSHEDFPSDELCLSKPRPQPHFGHSIGVFQIMGFGHIPETDRRTGAQAERHCAQGGPEVPKNRNPRRLPHT